MSWLGLDRLFGFRRVEKPAAAKPQRPASPKPAQAVKVPAPNVTQPKTGQTVVLSKRDSDQARADAEKLRETATPRVVAAAKTKPKPLVGKLEIDGNTALMYLNTAGDPSTQSSKKTEPELLISRDADTKEMEMPKADNPPIKPKSGIIKAGTVGKKEITGTRETTAEAAEDLLDKMLNRTRKKREK